MDGTAQNIQKYYFDMKHSVLFIITALCFLVSCNKEGNTESVASDRTVKIRLLVQESSALKSLPQVSEALLADLNLFVYDSNGSLTAHRYVNNPETEVTVEIDRDKKCTIYAIANTGDLSGRNEILSISGIQSMRWQMESPDEMAGPDGRIPMSGSLTLNAAEGGTTLTLYLTRLLSKFRIIVDTSGLDKDVTTFEIKQVRIRNMNKSVRYFQTSGAVSTSDVFELGLCAEGEDLRHLYSQGLDFYVPENIQGDLLKGNENEQEHIPPASHSGICTYIEFLVKYRNPEQYNDNLIYRYYLHDGNNLDNFDVKRNTMYTCRTIFLGSGLEDNSWRVDASGMKDLVTSITVTPQKATFYEIGKQAQLTAIVSPSSAENPTVTWHSDDENVATVSQSGLVEAVGDGNCTITASAMDGSGAKGYCNVQVYADSKIFEILDFPSIIYPGYNSPYRIKYHMYPPTLPAFSAECLSGDENSVMMYRENVIAFNPEHKQGEIGRFRIKGYANSMTAIAYFSVSGGELALNKLFSNFYVGIPSKLSLNKLEPADVDLNWSVSNRSLARIEDDGSITPLNVGKCTVTVESVTGISDTMTINILEPYISFIDVTMFEGATWTLVSSLRPISSSLPMEYSIVKGHEYVSINGNELYGLKRTNGSDDVIIRARLADYPNIYADASVTVVPAVTASLDGDNRVVNTYGHTSDGSIWSNFSNTLQLDVSHASNVSMIWEVYDEDGRLCDDISVYDSGLINPYSSTANGKYTIIGWDHLHRFRTSEIEIEVYRLLEYETGVERYGLSSSGGRYYYTVSLSARWSNNSWNVLNSNERNLLTQQNLITYPSTAALYHPIGAFDNPQPYIQNYRTNITQSGNGYINDLGRLRPLSYLREDFSSYPDNLPGIDGNYYKFTGVGNNNGYYYIKQRNETLFDGTKD